MNLDTDVRRCNTPEARESVLNIPDAMRDLTLESYAAKQPIPEEALAWLRDSCTSIDRKSLLLYGKMGRGKTGLGIGLLKVLARQGIGSRFEWNLQTDPKGLIAIANGLEEMEPSPVWFERWQTIVAKERRHKLDDEEGWFDLLNANTTVLMIDDIGLDQGTAFREGLLMRHIEWAEDKRGRALILTLNTSITNWPQVFGERIADRLTEDRRFTLVDVQGGNLRD